MTTAFRTSFDHNPETFADLRKVNITLINDLRRLRDFSKRLNLEKSIPQIDSVLERVHNKIFSVAVVGEFNRGKSTFINALLGREILPSDILPCSATLNRVTYGPKPKVKLILRDNRTKEIEIDELSDYVTKLTPDSQAQASGIQEAVVYYPVQYCQNGVDIIDTPGLNDEDSMTNVTLSVLPKVDVAIMVVLAQAPFANTERKFLEEKLLTSDLGRIIFVVTGIDQYKSPEEVDRGIQYVKDRINSMVLKRAKDQHGEDSPEYEVYRKKIGRPRVYGLSGYQALEAKLAGDNPQLLAESRFPEFEDALEKFLTGERSATFLQVPINRIVSSASEIIKAINLRENSLSMKQGEFRSAYDKSVAEIQSLRDRNTAEMRLIDEASAKVKSQIDPLIAQLDPVLKQAAAEAIDAADIRPADLRRKKLLSEKIGQKVSEAVDKAAKQQAEKIQDEISQGLLQEVDRLQDLAQSVDLALQRIDMEFSTVEAHTRSSSSAANDAVGAAVSAVPILGGAWLGYQHAGLKGAAVGAAGTYGTAFAAYMMAFAIGFPVTLPVCAVLGVISAFTGGWLSKVVFGTEQVGNFKASYKEGVSREIEKQLREGFVSQKVYGQVTNLFDMLKKKVREDVESLLDDTQRTLVDLRAKRERDEMMTEHEHQEMVSMSNETQRILGNAQRLSKQLIQKINL
ncbi:MAG: dynamin family protein [Phormidesmis sp.]